MTYHIKPPLDGSIHIPTLRTALFKHLNLLTGPPVETKNLLKLSKVARDAEGKPKYLYQIDLLSPLFDTETVKYRKLIAEYGGQTPGRLMGQLLLSNGYSQSMTIVIYGDDIQQTMFKKIRRLQEMLSGSGCPPIILVVRKSPRFAPISL